jgi:hypothetical protein
VVIPKFRYVFCRSRQGSVIKISEQEWFVCLFSYQILLCKILYVKEKNILVFESLNGWGLADDQL